MSRAIGSGIISFGLVNIPVKIFPTSIDKGIHFNQISPAGVRVKQKSWCSLENRELDSKEIKKGYEITNGQFIILTDEEIKSAQSTKSNYLDLAEFVPEGQINHQLIEKTYYLQPDKGGDKGYLLLSKTMKQLKKVAITKWFYRGRERLAAVISIPGDGLALCQMYFGNEVNAFDNQCAKLDISLPEKELAKELINKMSSRSFDHKKFEDNYSNNLLALIESKSKNKPFLRVLPGKKEENMVDLFSALKASLEKAG